MFGLGIKGLKNQEKNTQTQYRFLKLVPSNAEKVDFWVHQTSE